MTVVNKKNGGISKVVCFIVLYCNLELCVFPYRCLFAGEADDTE